MAKKYKLTGCARFFIFLVIFAPLVYFGVSYFKGEDPIAPFKNIEIPALKKSTPSNVSEESILNESLKAKDARIIELEKENASLREDLNEVKAENARLKSN